MDRKRKAYGARKDQPLSRLVTTGLLLGALLLGGCTAQTGEVDELGLRPHLTVDLQLPAQATVGETSTFAIDIARRGQPVTADAVRFVLWPETAPEHQTELAAAQEAPGRYSASYQLPEEGVYVVRALVEADELQAMPAKRFAIGADAVLELAALEASQSGAAPSGGGAGGHHDH